VTGLYEKSLLSWGKFQNEPATRCFDESFAPKPNWDKRFARQHRWRPSIKVSFDFSQFRFSSTSFGSYNTHSNSHVWDVGYLCSRYTLSLCDTHYVVCVTLACMIDSLVRVSRRDAILHDLAIHTCTVVRRWHGEQFCKRAL